MNDNVLQIKLLCVIVNYNQGSKILKAAKLCGIGGGTIFLGQGTVTNKLLEFLDLNEVNKEVVFMLSDSETVNKAVEQLTKQFHFEKPNHGIAFTACIDSLFGVHRYCDINIDREEKEVMYQAIYTIADKGLASKIIDAAKKAGARGGTIINARGSGIHETEKVFSMDIEPEKELVLILADSKIAENITSSISKELKLDEPGNGIIFTQSVSSVHGLY